MTTTTPDTSVEEPAHEEHAHDDDHGPSDRSYVMIALLLAVLTAVEVVFFIIEDDLPRNFVKVGLIVLMIVKFWIVGSYFMHLKFDKPILTYLFMAGLILAVVVYFIMLSAFEFSPWNDGFCDTGLPAAAGGEDFFANENCTS